MLEPQRDHNSILNSISDRTEESTDRSTTTNALPRISLAEMKNRLLDAPQYERKLVSRNYADVLLSVSFFKELFSAVELSEKYKNPAFVAEILNEVVHFSTVELSSEFTLLLVYFYRHKLCDPHQDIIAWAEAQFHGVQPPIAETHLILLCNLCLFFETISSSLNKVNMPAFFEHLARLSGTNATLDAKIASLLVQICTEIGDGGEEILRAIFPVVQAIFHASSAFCNEEVALDGTNVIQRIFAGLTPYGIPRDSLNSILYALRNLWGASNDVRDNLFMICQLLNWEDVNILWGSDGEAAMVNCVTSLGSSEALVLLGCVAASARKYDDLLPAVCHTVFHGGYEMSTCAGICLGRFMSAEPSLFAEAFSVECDDSEDCPNDRNFARAALYILTMGDSESTVAILDGMCCLYKFFLVRDGTHEFSEILDFYRISDLVEQLTSDENGNVAMTAEYAYMTFRGEFVYNT